VTEVSSHHNVCVEKEENRFKKLDNIYWNILVSVHYTVLQLGAGNIL
jgi:hypothetical protein